MAANETPRTTHAAQTAESHGEGSEFRTLIAALLEQNENYARQMELLTSTLATGLGDRGNGLRDIEVKLIRKYDITRRQLVGAADDEANTASPARIISIIPSSGRVGDSVTIHLRNAGVPTRVSFTGDDGGTVSATPEAPGGASAGRTPRDQVVRCRIPDKAAKGPVTVTTDSGDAMSAFDFTVTAGSCAPVAGADLLFAHYRQEGLR